MQYNEECNGISHRSIIGRFFWKLPENDIHEDGPSRYGPPTTTNTCGNIQYSDKQNLPWNSKKKRAIDMIFYWVRYRIQQNHSHIFWGEGKENLADYVTKNHPIWHHRTTRPRYVKATKKDTENSKDRRTGTKRGCAGTNNTRRTRKLDNPLKETWNPIPRNPDIPLKGIWYLVQNRTQSQWLRGLTIPT